MGADLDDVLARLSRTSNELGIVRRAAPEVTTPAVAVSVIAMPEPQRWLFTVRRDDQGRIAAVLAEPIAP